MSTSPNGRYHAQGRNTPLTAPPENDESDDDREVLKALLLGDEEGKEDYFKLQARLVAKFGPPAGIFARQLIFRTGQGMTPHGWIYKKRVEMHAETGLSVRQQINGRKVLKAAGVLEEWRPSRRKPLYFRIHFGSLVSILGTLGDAACEEDFEDLGDFDDIPW